MNIVPPPAPDRCICLQQLREDVVYRVLVETCPEHGRWARHAEKMVEQVSVKKGP